MPNFVIAGNKNPVTTSTPLFPVLGAGRARTDDDGIMSVSNYGSTRVLKYLL